MRSYFPDINVWIALAYGGHEHHIPAATWLGEIDDDSIYFCRFTQLGFLRLLTNAVIMKEDVKNQHGAWEVYDLLLRDERFGFLPEPGLEQVEIAFRNLTSAARPSTRQWPDAYVAAFAEVAGLTVVTFDRALHRMANGSLLLT